MSLMRRTYRYRIYPTRRQARELDKQLGEACDLYNAALQHRRDLWREHHQSVSFYDQDRELKDLRAAGLIDPTVSFCSQRATLRRLDRAFAAFYRRCKTGDKPGFPRFRSRRRFDTLEWPIGDGAALTDAGRLRLQNVGHVKVKLHRPIPASAKPCTAQVTRRPGGRWFASISLDNVPANPLPSTGETVGIDLGISTFAALSTGELIDGPRAERTAAAKVRRAARRVARRRRGSQRRRRAVGLLARAREHERQVRRDHAHKLSRELVERFDVIAVENLNVQGLAKSALARDVNDQGWSQFVILLGDKAEDAGRQVVPVDARQTSQECSACGAIVTKTLSQRVHRCECGYHADRDVNAARVILSRALRAQTTGPDGAVDRQRWGDESRAVDRAAA